MNKNIVPKDFTLSMAIFDGLPVLFFCISILLISAKYTNPLFLIGGILCFFAGFSKVLWKIVVVLKKKNIWFLFIQMRITMPIGFILIIISIIVDHKNIDLNSLLNTLTSIPQLLFFVLGVIGMILMTIFAFTLDGKKAKNNWLEQVVNCLAQLCFLIGVILAI